MHIIKIIDKHNLGLDLRYGIFNNRNQFFYIRQLSIFEFPPEYFFCLHELSSLLLLFSAQPGVAGVSMVSGCQEGNGVSRQEQRQLPDFSAVEVDGAFDVTIVAGQERQEVVVTTDANLLSAVITEVRDGVLSIRTRGSVCPRAVRIHQRTLQSVVVSGSNQLDLSGVDGDALRLAIYGAGNATVAGRVGLFAVKVMGSSELQAETLVAQDVEVLADGASSAVVRAERSLKAVSSGASQVTYYGTPRLDRIERDGVGEIFHR